MLNFVLEIVCAFLMAMSLIFVTIELRARFDRSFLIFGISIFLQAIFCSIDIWIQPYTLTLYWTKIQHIIAAFFPVFIIWYLLILVDRYHAKIIKILFFNGTIFTILFFSDLMLKPSAREITGTALYNFVFAPYVLLTMIYIFVILFTNYSRCPKNERKVLIFHFVGFIGLFAGGILDMITILVGHRIVPEVASFVIPGVLLFGLIVTSIFIDRLTTVIRDREHTFAKLQVAYKEMEEVQSLKELGQSSAIINHEIRNFTFVISGYTQLLLQQLTLTEKQHKMLQSISDTIKKMSEFSEDILNFSKARILGDKRPLSLLGCITSSIANHFLLRQSCFNIENIDKDLIIHGDWNKLEHVFVNMFKNSFEAGAQNITIRALRSDSVLLLVVEDDGNGCSEEELPLLFKSFHTTKKLSGGTGLGMCVVRSIIESHGGHISGYSKNLLNNGQHGLFLTVAFPLYSRDDSNDIDKKDSVILIKDRIANLPQVIRVFQNICVNPLVFQSVDDIDAKKSDINRYSFYGTPSVITVIKSKFPRCAKLHALTEGSTGSVFVVNEISKGVQVFSESYVFETLG